MDLTYKHSQEPVLPSQEEVLLARESSRKLAAYVEPDEIMNLKIQDKKGNEADIELPASVVRLLLNMLEHMANGNAVSLIPLSAELSTTQAAEVLNVSRPYVIKLLDEGEIPSRKVGSHRRVKVADVLKFKRESYIKRSKILAELSAEAQKLKWGYE